MMNSNMSVVSTRISSKANNRSSQKERFVMLLERDVLSAEELQAAEDASLARGIELEKLLLREHGIPRRTLLEALSQYYHCPFVEYDERIPIPPELLAGLNSDRLFMSQWCPVMRAGNTVIIAANNPEDPAVRSEVREFVKSTDYEFRVALADDIQWFIQDFLHARPGYIIGTERTGLAFWRNTMAQWRTRLACYRNDLAMGRTGLGFLRWGLGIIAIADTFIRANRLSAASFLFWFAMAAGLSTAIYGLSVYLKVRRSRMKPPGHHTLVEVTSVTLQFLENYHFIEGTGIKSARKRTMLGRLGDFLANHCTILYPAPASRERTHLARERNVLAGQRTVAACYRTLYARARTGLAFIRSGISFLSFGFGLMHYFGLGILSIMDSLLILAGLLMTVDGALWYLPVRKEQAEIPRCPVPQ